MCCMCVDVANKRPFPINGDALQHVARRPDGLHFRLLEKRSVSVLKSQVRTVNRMSKILIMNPLTHIQCVSNYF